MYRCFSFIQTHGLVQNQILKLVSTGLYVAGHIQDWLLPLIL